MNSSLKVSSALPRSSSWSGSESGYWSRSWSVSFSEPKYRSESDHWTMSFSRGISGFMRRSLSISRSDYCRVSK